MNEEEEVMSEGVGFIRLKKMQGQRAALFLSDPLSPTRLVHYQYIIIIIFISSSMMHVDVHNKRHAYMLNMHKARKRLFFFKKKKSFK